jgi:hypothetical protein
MQTGNWLHLPFPGGVWNQPEGLMELVNTAWQAWYIFKYMPDNKLKWQSAHADFIAWIDDDGTD